MDTFVESIKQYPAKEQAELHVRVKLPGSIVVQQFVSHVVTTGSSELGDTLDPRLHQERRRWRW